MPSDISDNDDDDISDYDDEEEAAEEKAEGERKTCWCRFANGAYIRNWRPDITLREETLWQAGSAVDQARNQSPWPPCRLRSAPGRAN